MRAGWRAMLRPESIVKIFNVCARQFPNKFREMQKDEAAREVWFRQLKAEGITDAMVDFALSSTGFRALEWPPSVGEFVKLSRPTAESLGLPPVAKAQQEIQHAAGLPGSWEEFPWSHAVVYHTAKSLKVQRGVIQSADGSRLIASNYAEMCRRFIAGDQMGSPVQPKLTRQAPPARTEEQKRAISQMLRDADKGKAPA